MSIYNLIFIYCFEFRYSNLEFMFNRYHELIFTTHSLSRLRQRGISQGDAWATWRNPDKSRKGKNGSWVYYKTYGDQIIEVVAKKNEKGEWLVLSVWSKYLKNQSKKTESFFSFLVRKFFG